MARGYSTPNITVVTKVNHRAIRKFFFITSSNHPKIRQQHVDKFDSDKGSNNSANAIQQQVPLQQSRRAERPITHAAQRERDQGDDDQRVKNYGGKDGGLRRAQVHYVQGAEHWKSSGKHSRNDREILGHVVSDRKRRQRPTRNQELLADFHDFDQLRGVGIDVDHVSGFFRGLRAGVHGHSHVRLSEGRSVVCSVASHGHEFSLRLFPLDERHLVFRLGFGEEIVNPSLTEGWFGRQRVITGNHHGANAHSTKVIETLLHSSFDDICQSDRAQYAAALGNQQRGSTRIRNL